MIILYKYMSIDIKYTDSLTYYSPQVNKSNLFLQFKDNSQPPQKEGKTLESFNTQPNENVKQGFFMQQMAKEQREDKSRGWVKRKVFPGGQQIGQEQALYFLQLQRRESSTPLCLEDIAYKKLYLETREKYAHFKQKTRRFTIRSCEQITKLKTIKESVLKQKEEKQSFHQFQVKGLKLQNELQKETADFEQREACRFKSQKQKIEQELCELRLAFQSQIQKSRLKQGQKMQAIKEMLQEKSRSVSQIQLQQQELELIGKQMKKKQQLVEKAIRQRQSATSQLTTSLNKAKQDASALREELNQYKLQQNQSTQRIKELIAQLQKQKGQLEASNRKYNRLLPELQALSKQKQQLQLTKAAQISKLKEELSKSQCQKRGLREKVIKGDGQLRVLGQQMQKAQQKMRAKQKQKSQLIEEVRQWKDQTHIKTENLNKAVLDAQNKQTEIDLLSNNLQVVYGELHFQHKNIEHNQYAHQIHQHFIKLKAFNESNILQTNSNQKIFLHEAINQFMGTKTFNSRLRYRFDPLNNTNFHNYIDYIPNLIIFIKLFNHTIVGGFTAHPFDPEQTVRPGNGFLFTVTEQKVYKMRQNPRLSVNTYDKYYFILGNAQIRLKAQQKKLFSNFGISSSTFESCGETKNNFLNVQALDNSQVQIESYEIFQLIFE